MTTFQTPDEARVFAERLESDGWADVKVVTVDLDVGDRTIAVYGFDPRTRRAYLWRSAEPERATPCAFM